MRLPWRRLGDGRSSARDALHGAWARTAALLVRLGAIAARAGTLCGHALLAAALAAWVAGGVETVFAFVRADSIHSLRTGAGLLAAGLGLWLSATPALALLALSALALARLPGPRQALSALADPARQAAALAHALLALGLGVALILAPDALESLLLPAFKDADLVPPALRGALFALLVGGGLVALGLAAPLRIVLQWVPARFGLRLLLVGAGVAALSAWLLAEPWHALAKDLPKRAVFLPLGALALCLPVTVLLRRRRPPPWLFLGAPALALPLVAAGYLAFDALPGVRLALADANGFIPVITGGAQRLLDADGDGYSPYFGGNDCNDADPDVNPAGSDLPGDGVDQDCTGTERPAYVPVQRKVMEYAARPPQVPNKLNILLVTVDALRADHLPFYGYPRETAPRLAALAERSVVFDRAYTTAGSTAYAVPSLLSGRRLADLDIEFAGHYFVTEPGQHLFFERLRAAGYDTEAHMAGQLRNGMWLGLDAGIDRYVGHADVRLTGPSAPAMTEAALQAIDRAAAQTTGPPFALWLHYHDPHEPYTPHGPPDQSFGTEDVDRYDGEIAYFDRYFGQVLDALEKKGLAASTAIVVTSDHGEELEDHGRRFHGKQQFEESIRVPLLFHVPGIAPRRSGTAVSIQDVPDTLANLAGLTPGLDYGARSLVGDLQGTAPEAPDRPLMVETILDPKEPRGRLVTRIEWPHKLILDLRSGAARFFDLEDDPGERRNLADEAGPAYEAMRAALTEVVERGDAQVFDRLKRRHVSRRPPAVGTQRAETVAVGLQWLGAELHPQPRIGPRAFELRQWFRGSGAQRGDYRIRVAWYDRTGTRLDQRDYVPLAGHYPTSVWANGEIVEDVLYVLLKRGKGAVEARLSILEGLRGGKVVFGPRTIDTVTLPGTL